MKHAKAIPLLLLALCAASAEEDPRARARDLEVQAEKALDEGRRADAMRLLAEAAELRANARAMAGDRAPQGPKPPDPREEPAAMPAPPAETAAAAAGLALKELDAALGKGDAAAMLEAGRRAREALALWAKDLEARERQLAEREKPVEKRLAELEAQVAKLMAKLPKR